MKTVRASLIIAAYNQLKYTELCIDSILRDQDRIPYEIIVIDNGSGDGTRAYLEQKAKDLQGSRDRLLPIFNEKNLGVAPAWNQGLRLSTGQVLGILNNDIRVSLTWFRSLIWALDHHKLALISPFAATGELNYDFDSRAAQFTKQNLCKLWKDYDFCAAVFPRSTFD
ncbi:MAG: glycosyltransferase, partial [Bdellovibrionota bacterium]